MNNVAKEAIKEIREMCWGYDIPSPCCPEYREHHEQMQKIIGLCDSWLKKLEEGEAKMKKKKTVTLGQFLDLIDCNRESEEHVNIMNGNGEVLVRGMVCYDAWEEDREINSISINEDCEYMVWLEDRKEGGEK